nr:PH108-3-99(-) [Vibrio phage 1]
MRQQFERERAIREDNIRRFSTSEKQRQQELRKLERETEEFIIQSHQREADAVREARSQAYQDYQKYADQVKQFEDEIAEHGTPTRNDDPRASPQRVYRT